MEHDRVVDANFLSTVLNGEGWGMLTEDQRRRVKKAVCWAEGGSLEEALAPILEKSAQANELRA